MLLMSSYFSFSQGYIKDMLRHKMDAQDLEFYPIVIKFKKQVDIKAYKESLVRQNLPLKERQKLIVKKLFNENKTPEDFLAFAKLFDSDIADLKIYWLVNSASCKASRVAIEAMLELSGVEYIQYDVPTIPPKVEKVASVRAVNQAGGVEPGVVTIQAPEMWKLGYTGRNKILMSFDTGVNIEHAAVGSRFLGHYVPMSQTWFGVENDYPYDTDVSHHHGTHTTGTVLGLDKANSDTVGVAFNAFWIACDLIVSSIEDIRPISVYYTAFQWALNPDGDINTSHDIPDVINNSWGADYDTWPDCNPLEYEYVEALEAADCSVIFSAGNEGPNPETIGMPAGITKDSLNIFSVGALNAHNSSFPIADFSSRGPTTCVPIDSPEAIKPEVSAPGVNVRSSAGTGEYISISGTSMAAPHVSGAALLLREAFPNITSTELKNALYQTAIDLGEPEEDNTYGKGIIDVKAAYDFLAETHTPTPPIGNSNDLEISEVLGQKDFSCSEENTYSIEVKNNGTEDVNQFNLRVILNADTVQDISFDELLASGTSTQKTISINLTEASNNIQFQVYKTGITEQDIYNNYKSFDIQRLYSKPIPYSEDFEQAGKYLVNSEFAVVNPDFQKTWGIDSTEGLENNYRSLKMPFVYYGPRERQKDYFILGMFDIPQTGNTYLNFKHSYTQYFNSRKDSLYILVSDLCDLSSGDTVFVKGGSNLKTREDNFAGNYVPTLPEEWADNAINLTAYAGETVVIKLIASNDKGNNLYIDNINIENGSGLGVQEQAVSKLNFYPNPAKSKIYFDASFYNKTVTVISSAGEILLKTRVKPSGVKVSNLPTGSYIIECSDGTSGKLVIKK